MGRERSHWGWGWKDEALPDQELRAAAEGLAQHLGFGSTQPRRPVALAGLSLRAPRLRAPRGAGVPAGLWAHDLPTRARHTYGKAYRDVVRAFNGRFDEPPDLVARPREEAEIEHVLEWAASAGAAVIPFGGGTSVVGGVEARGCDSYAGVVSLDLTALDRVLEVDPISRAARIEAGVLGPALEEQLKPHGLTLRHYPQSFQLSTLGGWIATRAGGHFATLQTHIDDLVESVRAITPSGVWASRRLPGSGAGPSPDRLLLGSEGILGVVTEAWVRLRPPPVYRTGRAVRFASFQAGGAALRALAQSGLYPENCRLIDPREAALTFAGDGSAALLVLGFESATEPVDGRLTSALALCAKAGGAWDDAAEGARGGAVGSWREAFLRAPYVRDVLVSMGVLSETFETAITWERFDRFVAVVRTEVEAAVRTLCGEGLVSCRVTHVYPDGAAPYFTVVAPVDHGAELETWDEIKRVASEAILAGGGTITHHHAVGRDHRPWYDHQRPEPFALALGAAKAAVDPTGMLNPGVLIDPRAAA
ncbi:MAG TPA: FAD-binding oxidoreductase [Conexibacter sp.]|jgi:alkyldihydroxyacetonephosphate synthase